MNFKLPHDNFCTCAKRDEPPSRRRPTVFAELKAESKYKCFSSLADVCEAFCIFRVFSGLIKFVSIRVYSWFLFHDFFMAGGLSIQKSLV